MYNKVLTGIVVVLSVAIIICLGYLGYNYYKKITLNSDAEEFLQEFDTMVVKVPDEDENNTVEPEPPIEQKNNSNSYTGTTNNFMYKGFPVIGKLEMPSVGIKYPILEESTSAKAIEVSVVKIYGPGVNQPGNLVIAGHNYNNGLFFGKNKNLKVGDKIYLTDNSGNRVQYTIFNKYYTPESDSSYITRQTNGKAEVTLYTCDATGKNRLIVCARADE